MSFILPFEIKVRKGPLYFMAALFVLFVLIVADKSKETEWTAWLAAGGMFLFILLFFALQKLKLNIDNDALTNDLFFGKTKVFNWSEITSVQLHWHFHGHAANLALEIMNAAGKKTSIQPSFYTRKNLRTLAEAIMANVLMQLLTSVSLKWLKENFPGIYSNHTSLLLKLFFC